MPSGIAINSDIEIILSFPNLHLNIHTLTAQSKLPDSKYESKTTESSIFGF